MGAQGYARARPVLGNRYPPAALGGYERVWPAAVAALREAGHEVRVLTTAGASEGDAVRELRRYWRDFAFPQRSPLERLRLERCNARVLGRHLRDFAPDVVRWFGMGGMSLSLSEQVRRAGLPAVGVVADAAAAYAAADAVLFPVTWEEPWGLVPLEAMSVGRPVVATGTGGSAEYLRDGDNALPA